MTRRRHKKVKIDERDAFNKRRVARKVASMDLTVSFELRLRVFLFGFFTVRWHGCR